MNRWLFDLGNSRFKFAPLDARGGVGEVSACPHGAEMPNTAAASALPRGDVAYVASVASPALTEAVLEMLHARFGRVECARAQASHGALRIAYADPARLGVDRFLALLAGHAVGGDVVIAGVGTALTLDVLDASGRHRGGRIAASPTTMRNALHALAAQLPAQGGQYRELASDTGDALASGCDGAAVALIERTLGHAALTLEASPVLLLHGGGAPALLPLLPQARYRPKLVLEGLAAWALSVHG
jgi:type III pantothenate kinase